MEQDCRTVNVFRKPTNIKDFRAHRTARMIEESQNMTNSASPFEWDWPDVLKRLGDAPGLEAESLMEDFPNRYPDRYRLCHLRSFQHCLKERHAGAGLNPTFSDRGNLIMTVRLSPRPSKWHDSRIIPV